MLNRRVDKWFVAVFDSANFGVYAIAATGHAGAHTRPAAHRRSIVLMLVVDDPREGRLSAPSTHRPDEPALTSHDLSAVPPLRRFLWCQGIGQVADAATSIVLARVLFSGLDGGESGALSNGLLMASVPYVVAGPLAGVAADHWDRRQLLGLACGLRAVLTVVAIVVPLTADRTLGFILAGLLLSAARLAYTVRAAALPHVATPGSLVSADAMSLRVGMVAGIGGAVGAAILAPISPGLLLICAAGGHLCAAVGYARMPCGLGGRSGLCGGMPVAAIARRVVALVVAPLTRFAILVTSCHRALLGASFSSFVLLSGVTYGLGVSGYAAAIAVSSVGSFLGTLSAPAVGRRMSRNVVAIVSYATAAVAFVVAAGLPLLPIVMLAIATSYFAFQNLRVVADAIVQSTISDDARGRVFSVYDALYNLSYIGGAFAGVALHTVSSPTRSFGVVGVLYIAGVAAQAAMWPPASRRSR